MNSRPDASQATTHGRRPSCRPFLQGGEEVSRRAHNPEKVGAVPTPATNSPIASSRRVTRCDRPRPALSGNGPIETGRPNLRSCLFLQAGRSRGQRPLLGSLTREPAPLLHPRRQRDASSPRHSTNRIDARALTVSVAPIIFHVQSPLSFAAVDGAPPRVSFATASVRIFCSSSRTHCDLRSIPRCRNFRPRTKNFAPRNRRF